VNNPREILEQLLTRRDLSEAQAGALLRLLTTPDMAPAMAGALLSALRAKGVTPDEVRGFAGAMRALALKPALPAAIDAIDIVGTGGDGSGSLNLSTGAALLAAACGVPVVKHGNRSISSRSGSADLIEAIGFTLPLDENRAAECFVATGFTFLFAPYFHPAMKALAPIRAALGIRTVFNLLGPICNPAGVRRQLIGVFSLEWGEPLARVLQALGTEKAWVVHGADGLDEMTTTAATDIVVLGGGEISNRRMVPEDLGLKRSTLSDLRGGAPDENAMAIRELLNARPGPFRDIVLLNSAAALVVADKASDLRSGLELAACAVDSGKANEILRRFATTTQKLGA